MSTPMRTMACGLVLLATASGALAADAGTDITVGARSTAVPAMDYVARAGFSYTDNLFRSPAGTENSTGAAAFGVEANGSRDSGRLIYNAAVDLAYYAYFGEFGSEVFGNALLDGNYAFVPDTFFWNGTFRYDQGRADFSRPMVPGNVDDQISWSTGPEVRLRMGRTMEAQLEAHYEAQVFSGSQSDSNTIGGRALLAHRASPRSRLAVGGSYDQVSYSESAIASLFDFDRQEVFGRIEHSAVRSRMELEAGYSTVSGQAVDDSGPVFRGMVYRRLTPTLSADASYVHEYPTSSAPTFTEDVSTPGAGQSDNTLLTAAPRVADTLNASLRMQRTRTEASLSYVWRKEDSLVEVLGERDSNEWRFFVARQFTPKANGSFFAARSTENFTVYADDNTETTFGAQLTILFGQALGLDLRIEHRDRESENPLGTSKELAGGIFLRYSGAFGRRQSLEGEETRLQ
jgi:hypothetical protein